MTRNEMIRAMTKHELEFVMSDPDYLEIVTDFFAGGGYTVYSDDKLTALWSLKHEETSL